MPFQWISSGFPADFPAQSFNQGYEMRLLQGEISLLCSQAWCLVGRRMFAMEHPRKVWGKLLGKEGWRTTQNPTKRVWNGAVKVPGWCGGAFLGGSALSQCCLLSSWGCAEEEPSCQSWRIHCLFEQVRGAESLDLPQGSHSCANPRPWGSGRACTRGHSLVTMG